MYLWRARRLVCLEEQIGRRELRSKGDETQAASGQQGHGNSWKDFGSYPLNEGRPLRGFEEAGQVWFLFLHGHPGC